MAKKKTMFMVLAMLIFAITACGVNENEAPVETEEEQTEAVEPADNQDADNEKVEDEVEEPEDEFLSMLTGLPVDEEVLGKRPIAVMLDNHIAARPQSGLADAEIVYEILAEGNITRYMAIIQEADMNSVGPVRSARPYFLDKALEFDSLYVHVGGSMEALADIKDLQMADIDGMNRGRDTFWRTNHKKIPHNMYSSVKAIRSAADRSKYRTDFNIRFASFKEEDEELVGGMEAYSIRFGFAKYYKPAFIYNPAEKVYERMVKERPHLEEFSEEPIKAKNVIVLKMATRVVDDEGRLSIGTIGEGDGYYLSNGQMIDIKWKKQDRRDETVYLRDGAEIKLNPGNSWIVVVPGYLEIDIN